MRNREIVMVKLERIEGKIAYLDGQVQRMQHSEYVQVSNEIKSLIEEVKRYVNAEALSPQEMNPHL